MLKKPLKLFALTISLLTLPVTAFALPITFKANNGNRSASVDFNVVANQLIVKLANTSVNDVLFRDEILSTVFFDATGSGDFKFTPLSANLADNSWVTNNGLTDPQPNGVGGEWGYISDIPSDKNVPGGAKQGIGSTGLGVFGPQDRFPGGNLDGPSSLNGISYGLTGKYDNPQTMSGNQLIDPFVQNSIEFILGIPNGTNITGISNVHFLYGTSILTENILPGQPVIPIPIEPAAPVPEPATFLILAACVAGFKAAKVKKLI
ncbi:MAG: hypothetical protein HZA78_07530 [Candidatus Schekmanbacteria bacterium]|nr:hypothetical protein [Candidatus Schekmanbacteria bacterium]